MTTRVHIYNDAQSNKQQHAIVYFVDITSPSTNKTVALAPDEGCDFWLGNNQSVVVTEVVESKSLTIN